MSDDIAQGLSEQNQSIDRRFDERAQELGELRQYKTSALQREQAVQEAAHKQEQPDLGTMMYEDPDGFVGLIEKKIAKSEEKMTGQYQQAESSKKAQADFCQGHSVHPREHMFIAKSEPRSGFQFPDGVENKCTLWLKRLFGDREEKVMVRLTNVL